MSIGYEVTIESRECAGMIALRAGDEGRARVPNLFGAPLPYLPSVVCAGAQSIVPVAHDEWLIITSDALMEGRHGAVAQVTGAYGGFEVCRPDVRAVMALALDAPRAIPDDVTVTTFGRTAIGRAAGIIVRHRCPESYDIYVDITQARYTLTLLRACAGWGVPS